MQQKIVNLIGENKLFDVNIAFTETRDKVHGLCKVHVAVVITVNEKHRRFPGIDGSDGR